MVGIEKQIVRGAEPNLRSPSGDDFGSVKLHSPEGFLFRQKPIGANVFLN
jgi:hypothetical protein